MAQRSRGRDPRGIGIHGPVAVRDHVEEVAERLLRAACRWERRRRREPAPDDHAPAVAQLAVAGGAEDPVALLPALEDRAVDRERRTFGQLRPPVLARSGIPTIRDPGQSARIAPRDRARRPAAAPTCRPRRTRWRSSGSYRGWSYISLRQPDKQRAAAPQTSRQRRPERTSRRRRSIASRRSAIVGLHLVRISIGRFSTGPRRSPWARGSSRNRRVVLGVEQRVAGLDQRKNRLRDASAKLGHVEDRVVGPRQAVEPEHAHHGRQRRATRTVSSNVIGMNAGQL